MLRLFAPTLTRKNCNLLLLISLLVEFIIYFMTKKSKIYFFRWHQNNSINTLIDQLIISIY